MNASKPVLPMQVIIKIISEETNVRGNEVQKVIDAYLGLLYKHVAEDGGIFRLKDVGNIRMLPTEERMARNPRTGEKFKISPGNTIKFVRGSVWEFVCRPDKNVESKNNVDRELLSEDVDIELNSKKILQPKKEVNEVKRPVSKINVKDKEFCKTEESILETKAVQESISESRPVSKRNRLRNIESKAIGSALNQKSVKREMEIDPEDELEALLRDED